MTVAQVQSFDPVSTSNARVLILGSMPGVASLTGHEYYAHPRNALWPIVLSMITAEPASFCAVQRYSYSARTSLLKKHNLALWDVLAECVRPGSLDSNIENTSIKMNDLVAFITRHKKLERLIFNGKVAADLYKRYLKDKVDVSLLNGGRRLATITLPSTSPAMASMTLDEKCTRWHSALDLNHFS